jgi:hypothetical protein
MVLHSLAMKRFSQGSFIASMLLFPAVPAFAEQVECPSTIEVHEAADLEKLPGWRAHDTSINGVRHFSAVGFSEGPPEERVFQTPAKTSQSARAKKDVYDFSGPRSAPLWIMCIYSETALTVTKALSEHFSRCEVAWDEKTGFRTVKRFDCF